MTSIKVIRDFLLLETVTLDAICVFIGRDSKIKFIFREGREGSYDTEWEIDPVDELSSQLRYYFGTERVTREQFLGSIQEVWPDDFETIIWNLEILNCEWHGINNG